MSKAPGTNRTGGGITDDLFCGFRRFFRLILRIRLAADSAVSVVHSHQRMVEHNPRTSVSHDFRNPLFHVLAIAVNGAFVAKCLICHARALHGPVNGIIRELLT